MFALLRGTTYRGVSIAKLAIISETIIEYAEKHNTMNNAESRNNQSGQQCKPTRESCLELAESHYEVYIGRYGEKQLSLR